MEKIWPADQRGGIVEGRVILNMGESKDILGSSALGNLIYFAV